MKMRFGNKHGLALLAFVALVGAVTGAASSAMVTAGVFRVGGSGSLTSSATWDSLGGGQAGGQVYQYNAGTSESLKVGDVVYIKANNAVGKSATVADYNTAAGIVVGGQRLTGNGIANDSASVGTLVATAGQKVWVLYSGRAYTKTADSVYAGNLVIIGAVSGTIKRRSTALDSFQRTIGRAVSTIDSGKKVAVNVSVK